MTQAADWVDESYSVKEGIGKMLADRHLVGRFGEPDEVASVALLLAGVEGLFCEFVGKCEMGFERC
jgi:hypothetical protein